MRLENYRFRFSASGILFIIFNLSIILKHDVVETAALQKTFWKNEDTRIGSSCQKICETDNCRKEAQIFLDLMNPNVDPCNDFYEFACGKMKEIPISDDSNFNHTFKYLQKQAIEAVVSAIQEEIKPNDLDAFKKVKVHYQNCVSESRNDPDQFLELLKKVGGWPALAGDKWNERKFDWKEMIDRMIENNILLNFPMNIDLDSDMKNIISVSSPVAVISGLLNETEFESYCDYLTKTAVVFGVSADTVREEMKNMANFQQEIYKIRREKSKIEKKGMTIRELSEKHPDIPWLEILNKFVTPSGIVLNDTEIINIVNLESVVKSYDFISKAPKRILANHLTWMVFDAVRSNMPDNWPEVKSNVSTASKVNKGRSDTEINCLNEVKAILDYAVFSMYVRKNFNEESRKKVLEMYESIKIQMKTNLEEVGWLDVATRKHALKKLEAIRIYVGHAAELLNDDIINEYYGDLVVNPGSYIASNFNVSSFVYLKSVYSSLRKLTDKHHWTQIMAPYIVNAMHFPNANRIVLTTAYLQGLSFQLERPQYLNYGSVGVTIGHEITHAFDTMGRLFDSNGDVNNWWDDITKQKFIEKTECIQNQYSELIEPEFNFRTNGTLTLNENIADNGGFKLSYRAYNEWIKRNGISESCLPNLNYTPRQMFWISAARFWCSKGKRKYIKKVVDTETHAPFGVRVTGSLSNIKEFAEDFKCKVGVKMNPEKKCVVW